MLGDVSPADCSGRHAREARKRKGHHQGAADAGKGQAPRSAEPVVAAAGAATAGAANNAAASSSSNGRSCSTGCSDGSDVGGSASTAASTVTRGRLSQQQPLPLQGSSPPTQHTAADVDARWRSIGSFLDPSDRSRGAPLPTTSSAGAASSKPLSGLEERIEEAIAAKSYAEAEELSDRLSVRQLGERISKAVDAHEFIEAKNEVVRSAGSSRRKKRLKWGFEPKERWEMKANM